MKLARFGIPGGEKRAVLDAQGRLRNLSEHLADITADSLADQQLEGIAVIDIDQLPLTGDHVRIGPPVADVKRIRPGNVIELAVENLGRNANLFSPGITNPDELILLDHMRRVIGMDNSMNGIKSVSQKLGWSFRERPKDNLRTLSFTAKRNGGNCYEHANANE
jgi:hypothetical protein